MENTGLNNPLAFVTAGSFLSKNWKLIVGIGLGGILLWLIYDKFIKDDGNLKESKNHPKSNLSDAETKAIAESLYQAMDGVFKNDVQAIYNLLQGKSYNDFARISNAFGKRWRSDSLIPEKLTLLGWLNRELNDKEMNVLYSLMPNVIGDGIEAIAVGSIVASNKNNLKVHKVKQVKGTWTDQNSSRIFDKNKEIGKVKEIITPENPQLAVIDPGFLQSHVLTQIDNIIPIA